MGLGVGAFVGLSEGDGVGPFVGTGVGCFVGDFVGLSVGKEVVGHHAEIIEISTNLVKVACLRVQ